MKKKYGNDLKTMLSLLATWVIGLAIYKFGSRFDSPVITIGLVALGVVVLSYSIYSKVRYKLGKADYILFPTENDQFSKVASLTLGVMIIIACIAGIVWTRSVNQFEAVGLLTGALMLINGLINLPNGALKIKNNRLELTGLKEKADIRQLEIISINEQTISLTNIHNERLTARSFSIDKNAAALISDYISGKVANNSTLKIENNVQTT